MKTKRSQEAYLMIDHTNSPGISPEFRAEHNLPVGVAANRMMETAMWVCHICGGDIIIGPSRQRAMNYCPRHDSYSCDTCVQAEHETGVPHTTYQQKLEEIYNALSKGQDIRKLIV